MPNGDICIHCGWQYTNHNVGPMDSEDDDLNPKPGYTHSLSICPGFTAEQDLVDSESSAQIIK